MRLLADECCDATIWHALRSAGHDVLAIADISPQARDPAVIELAVRDGRILLTEDKDFGQLVHASKAESGGVILFRYPFSARGAIVRATVDLIEQKGEELLGRFVVVQPGRIRISPSPDVQDAEPEESG